MALRILRLDTSLFGEQGASSQLNELVVEQLMQTHGAVEVTQRDFARHPLPHFTAQTITALNTAPEQRMPEQQHIVELADTLIAELQAADVLIIAAPMYNFSVPSTLKAWVDHVARAGVTFRYTQNGPEGLVGDKPVYVVTTRGGIHKDEPSDGAIPFLHTYLNFLGLRDIRVIYAEGLNLGGDKRIESLAHAKTAIEQLVAA